MNYSKFAAIGLALVLLISIMPGIARAEQITISSELNFGDIAFHRTSWNRLEVRVVNSNSNDLQGTVVVGSGGDYVQDLFIEAGKTASVVFYLPPSELADGWSNRGSDVQISVRDQRGRELVSSRLNTHGYFPYMGYIGVLGKADNFTRLSMLENSQVVGIRPTHLDNALFAENFSVIIISDPGIISLSPTQQQNLKTWVEAGGNLVVGGGSGWRQTVALVPAEILPMQPGGVETISGAELEVLQLPVQPGEQDYTVAVGTVHGDVLLRAGDIPLLVGRPLGQGNVVWSALDLEAAPLENPANTEAFWRDLFLQMPPQGLAAPGNHWAIGQVFNSLSQDSLGSTLSPLRVFLLLIGYILLVGPINWLILRKFDRREWAWATIPVLAILFTIGAFTAGSLGRGTERILYQLNMVEVQSDNLAEISSYSGIFIPKRGSMVLESAAVGLVPMSGAVSTAAAGQSMLEFTNPPLWSVQRFYAADFIEIAGAFTVSAVSDPSHVGQLKLEVTNNSGSQMFDSYFRMGNSWYEIGELAPDETKSMTVSAQHGIDLHKILLRYSNTGSSGRWYEIDQMLPQAPFAFVGFGDEGLLPVDTDNKVALDMWIQVLDSSVMGFTPGPLTIPQGVLTPTVLAVARDNRWQYGDEFNFEGQGSFDLIFPMPRDADYSQGEYSLNLRNIWGQSEGKVEVYNFGMGQWQELSELNAAIRSQNQSIILEDISDLVRANRLTVRINYDGHLGFSLRGIDITVKGGLIND